MNVENVQDILNSNIHYMIFAIEKDSWKLFDRGLFANVLSNL